MLNRFALVCAALVLSPFTVNAQDRASKSLLPVPDPMFSPELASSHQVKGKLLLDVLKDIELSRQAARQSAAEARKEAAHLLAFNWILEFEQDAKGNLRPGTSHFQSPQERFPSGDSVHNAMCRIPKGVVLLAMKIQQSQVDSVDSGQGGEHTGVTPDELDLICGPDWIISWLEDENGNMIEGTAELHCGGQTFPLPF